MVKQRFASFFSKYARSFTVGTTSALSFTFCNIYSPNAQCREEERRYFQADTNPPISFVGLSGNLPLAKEVSEMLQVPLLDCTIEAFADGEVNVKLGETVRGHDVYIFQSICDPVHDRLMECLLTVTACRRASANTITVIAPYLAYSRVDRLKTPRSPIAAADILKLFETAGADFLLTVDIHRRQTEGFLQTGVSRADEKPCLFDSVESLRLSIPVVLSLDLFNPVIVCPSSTGVTRAKKYQQLLQNEGVNGDLAFVSPCDTSGNLTNEDMNCHHRMHPWEKHILIGDVANCDVLIIDDMIDTGSRVAIASELCRQQGAKRIYAFATHGIFSADAIERLENAPIDEIYVTDTIPEREGKVSSKILFLSVAPLLAEAIRRKTIGMSLQSLTNSENLPPGVSGK